MRSSALYKPMTRLVPRAAIGASMAAILAVAAISNTASAAPLKLTRVNVFQTGIFDDSAAEIVSYDQASGNLFVTNASTGNIDVYDITGGPAPINSFSVGGGGPNSVSVNNGIVAVAVEAPVATDPGQVKFYNTAGVLQKTVNVGALPDMLTFTPDGSKVVVANEGEPGAINPEGSVSIIDLSSGLASASVTNAGFTAFNGQRAALKAQGGHFSPGTTLAEDVEPEYIAVSADSKKAFVALQETNLMGVVDLDTGTVTDVFSLGLKDHSQSGNGLDPSDRDSAINIQTQPVFGMYQPDAIATFNQGGTNYIVTANEGDARSGEDERIKNLDLDPTVFTDPDLQDDDRLGRLEVSLNAGQKDADGDDEFETLYTYGSRSFSIYDENGNQVFDSGDQFEQIIAATIPNIFNSNNDDNDSFDSRSDAKGPEPEALTLGMVDGRLLAFIGLERVGGIMVYDITDPNNPLFLLYQNDRDFTLDDDALEAGLGNGMGPEGMTFINAADNPLGKDLLVVAHEVSGTTEVYAVEAVPLPASFAMMAAGVGGLALLARRRQRKAAA